MNTLKPDLLPFLSALIVTLSDLPIVANHITKHQPIKATVFFKLVYSSYQLLKLIIKTAFSLSLLFYCSFLFPLPIS